MCDCSLYETWDSNVALYNTDDIVIHENNIYISKHEGCESDDIKESLYIGYIFA